MKLIKTKKILKHLLNTFWALTIISITIMVLSIIPIRVSYAQKDSSYKFPFKSKTKAQINWDNAVRERGSLVDSLRKQQSLTLSLQLDLAKEIRKLKDEVAQTKKDLAQSKKETFDAQNDVLDTKNKLLTFPEYIIKRDTFTYVKYGVSGIFRQYKPQGVDTITHIDTLYLKNYLLPLKTK